MEDLHRCGSMAEKVTLATYSPEATKSLKIGFLGGSPLTCWGKIEGAGSADR